MFLFEKYRPKNIRDFIFNKNILDQLIHISSNEDIPHIIISGPPGGGKKTLVKFFLEELYDPDVNILSKIKYNINGSSAKKEIDILQSNYHMIFEPTSTNYDKYILQEIIKLYTMHKSFNIFRTKRKFKTIVIYNIENLASSSQAALRRTMEIYAKTCRFIMVCNNLSKIFDPLKSRCRIFCVPLPSTDDILNVISYISFMENIILKRQTKEFIMDNCNGNLKKAIWILDCFRLKCPTSISLDDVFENVIQIFLSVNEETDVAKLLDDSIRPNIYNILITNIKGSEIISILLDKLIQRIDDDEINARIIQCASDAEYNLIPGRREITHIEFFSIGVIYEFVAAMKRNKTENKKVLRNSK